MSDWRYALRRLRRTPVFTLFGVLTLGLGIGTTTGIYSAVRAVVGPPSGVRSVDRIVNLYHAPGGSPAFAGFSLPDYQDLRARQTVFEQVTAWSFLRVSYGAEGQTGTSFGEIVGGEYFDLLGVTPARGRLLQDADDRPGAPPVVAISHATWQRVFAGAEDVVGRSMKVNGHSFEVIGVAPPEFKGLFNNGIVPSALWIPIASAAQTYRRSPGRVFDPSDRESRFLLAKARLKAGRTLEDARAELSVVARQLDAEHPIGTRLDAARSSAYERTRPWHIRRMADVRVNESDAWLVDGLMAILMLAVGAVLLVACTNLANLFLARGSERQQELAVRRALGASRWRLVRESLSESLVLAAGGGLLGLGVARVLIVLVSGELAVSGAAAVIQLNPRIDLAVLLVAFGATALAITIAGLLPALHSTRSDTRAALASAGGPTTAPRWWGRRHLITAQVTVSVILLTIAALAVTQVQTLNEQDLGFAVSELAVAEVDFEAQAYDDVRIERIVDAFLGRMAAERRTVPVTVASGLPVGPSSYRRGYLESVDGSPRRFTEILAGSRELLPTLGIPMVHGRPWDARDPAGAQVAVINQTAARTLFGTTDVVGRKIALRDGMTDDQPVQTRTVIGVAADTGRDPGMRPASMLVYVPFRRDYGKRLVFVARTQEDAGQVAGTLRQILRSIDPELVLRSVGAGPEVVGSNAQFFELSGAIAALLGAFAWVLAIGGLYGVLSHLVLRRTREIGIRLALGAERRVIITMVLREGLAPVALGVAAGLGIGALARAALQTQFLRLVPAIDPLIVVLVPTLFICVAVLACYVPARRAASVEPNTALRQV